MTNKRTPQQKARIKRRKMLKQEHKNTSTNHPMTHVVALSTIHIWPRKKR